MAEKTPAQQVKAKQAAIASSRKARKVELQLLEEELKLSAEIEGKELDRAKLADETAKLKQSFLEEEKRLLQEVLRLQISAGHKTQGTLDALKESNVAIKAGNTALDARNAAQDEQNKLLAEQDALLNEISGYAKNFAQMVGFAGKEVGQLNRILTGVEGQLINIAKSALKMEVSLEGAKKSVGKMAKAGAKAYTDTFSLGTVLGTVGQNALSMANEMNRAEVASLKMGFSMKQATRFNEEADAAFVKVGGSAEQLLQTYAALEGQSSRLGQKMGPDFVKQLSQANKVGLDQADTAQLMSERMIQQGESTGQAKEFMGDLVAISKSLKEPVGKSAKEFAKFSGRLNQFGPRSLKVFKRLKEVAHASGVEIGKLLDLAKGFDTFEGAAEAAARLNVVLGTQLDSLELVNASDEERIDMIRDAIKAKGGLAQISAKEARLLEEVIPGNLSLSEIMGLTNDVQLKAADVGKKHAGQMDELAASAEKAQTWQERMANQQRALGREMAGPVKDAFDTAVESYSNLSSKTQALIQLGMGLVGTFLKIATSGPSAGAGIGVGAVAAGKGLATMNATVAASAPAAALSAKVLGMLTVVILGVGAAIWMAAEGMASLVNAISGTAADRLMAFGTMMTRILMAINPIGMIFLGIEMVVKALGEAFVKVGKAAVPFQKSMSQLMLDAQEVSFFKLAGFARFTTNVGLLAASLAILDESALKAVSGALGGGGGGIGVKGGPCDCKLVVELNGEVFQHAVKTIVKSRL